MSAPSKIEQLREIKGRLPQAGLALTAMITVIALLAFGPVMPQAALWHFIALPPASPATKVQAWAGHLENPAEQSQPATQPLTSASYTSGFDKAAAGVAPERVPRAKSQQTRDPRACPDGLNCSFRTANVVPPRRPPDNAASVAVAPASAGQAAPPPHRSGFAALTSGLPSPRALLKPFTFVADTFTGLIRKL
jgi:hypothetical protein